MMGDYFATEEQVGAKNWRMVEECKSLRAEIARLEDEVHQFAGTWSKVGNLCTEQLSARSFKIADKTLTVQNASHAAIATVPWEHFDLESIKRLLIDLDQTRASYADITKKLGDLGVNLSFHS